MAENESEATVGQVDPELEKLIDAEVVAGVLDTSVPRVYELAREDRIPGTVRLGRQIRFRPSGIRQFIESGGYALPGGWRREPGGVR